jgi:hypothetical protein
MLSFLIFPSLFSQYQHCIFPRCIVAQHQNTLLLLYVELGISLYLLVYFRCQFSLYFNICLVPTISTHVLNVVVDAPFLLLLLILYHSFREMHFTFYSYKFRSYIACI